MTSRSYCFTYFADNEILDRFEESFNQRLGEAQDVRYCVWQNEICPGTSREHIQGYLELKKPWRSKRAVTLIGDGAHVEKRRGTRESAREYCLKEESRHRGPFEFGEWTRGGAGRRNDILALKEAVKEGKSEKEIADEFFGDYLRYHKGIRRYIGLQIEPRDFKTQVHILWGDAGTGKTKYVYDTFGAKHVYDVPRPNGGSVWFDGLRGDHRVCLLDDFYGWVPLHLLLKLGDRYPLQLPIKGGMVEFRCEHLFITSNKPWIEWYRWDEFGVALKEAFMRRIDECKRYNKE